ncbi:DNA/RNA nuclease SfsA [bacterium]|nr:DNA/RNA nuclease SfsA [bacterium]
MHTGIFIEEAKERFIGYVKIDSQIEECYISSSSHLNKLINLKNKKVLLTENKGKNLRTRYTIQAVANKNSIILVNLNFVNSIVYEYLKQRYKNLEVKREVNIQNYKSDFYVPANKTIIEVKSMLSESETATFPSIYGERALRQLEKIYWLLQEGYNIDYYFIFLNSNIKNITLNNKYTEFNILFRQCLDKGLNVKYFYAKYKDNNFIVNEIKNSKSILIKSI